MLNRFGPSQSSIQRSYGRAVEDLQTRGELSLDAIFDLQAAGLDQRHLAGLHVLPSTNVN